jgi:hypothetical protein
MNNEFKKNFDEAFAPISRLIAHGIAVAIGFMAICAISMIPIITLKILIFCGIVETSETLHKLETAILFGDLLLFLIILVAGILIFIKEETLRLWKRFFGDDNE